MALRDFEARILRELREVTGNKKLRQKDIAEWSTGEVTPRDDEKAVYLPAMHVYVAYVVPKPAA